MPTTVFIDTNILISASLSPTGAPARAYEKASHSPYSLLTSDTVVAELREVYARKFPDKLAALDAFWEIVAPAIDIVATPDAPSSSEAAIRDVKDRPILRAAIAYGADILLTGDKDFLESNLTTPRIMTAADFLEL